MATYKDLREQVRADAEDGSPEFTESIDNFIRRTENMISLYVTVPKAHPIATVPMLAGNNSVSVPDDCLGVESYNIVGKTPLLQKDETFILEAYPDPTYQDQPLIFAPADNQTLLLGPTPNFNYVAVPRYVAPAPSLVDFPDGTYISSFLGAALFHGCMMQAAIFMRDSGLFQMHQPLFEVGLAVSKSYIKGRYQRQSFEEASAANGSGELS